MEGCILPDFDFSDKAIKILDNLLDSQGVFDQEKRRIFYRSIRVACQHYVATQGDDFREKEIPVKLRELRDLLDSIKGPLDSVVNILNDEDLLWEAENLTIKHSRPKNINIERRKASIELAKMDIHFLFECLNEVVLPRQKKRGRSTDFAGHNLCEMILQACLMADFRNSIAKTYSPTSGQTTGGAFDVLKALEEDNILKTSLVGTMETLRDEMKKEIE